MCWRASTVAAALRATSDALTSHSTCLFTQLLGPVQLHGGGQRGGFAKVVSDELRKRFFTGRPNAPPASGRQHRAASPSPRAAAWRKRPRESGCAGRRSRRLRWAGSGRDRQGARKSLRWSRRRVPLAHKRSDATGTEGASEDRSNADHLPLVLRQ